MIFTLTDRNYNILDVYDTDDYLIGVYTGYIIKSLDINIDADDDRASNWEQGNYIFCRDKKGYDYWFTIRLVEDGDTKSVKSLKCYSGTLDILNEDANPIMRPAEPQPFEYYFDKIFYDTGISIGVNEIEGLSRRLEFTSENARNVEMLQYVLNAFDNSEADLVVTLSNSVPTNVKLNVFRRIGKEEPQTLLTDENDTLMELNRSGDITDLATCLNPIGVDEEGADLTLVGKYYEEKDSDGNILYYSPKDSPRIFSKKAREQFFVQMPGKDNGEFDGYINRRYSSEATTQDALWTAGLTQLKKIDHPIIEYEASGDIDCEPGDAIQIISTKMKPAVRVNARVIEYKFNEDDPSRNEYVFGNYRELESNIDEFSRLIEQFRKMVVSVVEQTVGYRRDSDDWLHINADIYGRTQIWGSTELTNLNVSGTKNAIHVTRDGVRATPAYETAESYLGDIGEETTGDDSLSVVPIEELFSDTVNTSIPYQVFLQSYGDGDVRVIARNEEYFVVKSTVPNIPFAWEVKAKRRGYENDRLTLDEDYDNKHIKKNVGFCGEFVESVPKKHDKGLF